MPSLEVIEILCGKVHGNKVLEYYLPKCHTYHYYCCILIQLLTSQD